MSVDRTDAPLPKFVQREVDGLADALKHAYCALSKVDGLSCEFLTFDPHPDDQQPLCAFVLVLPYSLETEAYRDSVARMADRLLTIAQQWEALEAERATDAR